MNLLADTHVLIWMLGSPETLSENAAAALDADQNTVFFSHVSVWELEIKVSRGRLKMPSDWVDCLRDMGLVELPIRLSDTRESAHLPWHHRDPFDRLLLAQAIAHSFTLVTRDAVFSKYAAALMPA